MNAPSFHDHGICSNWVLAVRGAAQCHDDIVTDGALLQLKMRRVISPRFKLIGPVLSLRPYGLRGAQLPFIGLDRFTRSTRPKSSASFMLSIAAAVSYLLKNNKSKTTVLLVLLSTAPAGAAECTNDTECMSGVQDRLVYLFTDTAHKHCALLVVLLHVRHNVRLET